MDEIVCNKDIRKSKQHHRTVIDIINEINSAKKATGLAFKTKMQIQGVNDRNAQKQLIDQRPDSLPRLADLPKP